MNPVKEYQVTSENSDASYEELLRKQKAHIAQKKKKRRKRQRMMNIAFVCAVLIIICVWGIAYMLISNKDDYHEHVSSAGTVEVTPVNTEQQGNSPSQTGTGDFQKNEYMKISYSDETKLDRYEAYHELNPDMSAEDVVWRVNSNLDQPMYGYDVPVSGYDDPYIIVNKYNKVPDGYRPPDLEDFDGQYLREETGNAYEKMRDDARAAGFKIRVVSGYRSVEYQKGLYNRYLASDSRENVDRYSARPGYSEHHTGMAMDIFGSSDGLRNFENTPEYPWVRDNCYKYGFIIRYLEETEEITGYESEPWHLRYVGVEVSTDMKEKNINNFEEYHAKYIAGK